MSTALLVDDHPIARQGIRRLFERQGGMQVVGETDRGLEAITLAEQLQPDIAVVDLGLPDLSGVEVSHYIRRVSPHTRIIILSVYSDEQHVLEALQAGALAYIIKGASAETFLYGIAEALAGRHYLSPPLTDRAVDVYLAQVNEATRPTDRYELLTDREREVLELLARGATYAEIGEKLCISPRTAETHRTNLMRKLDLKTQADITLYAVQRGLIDPAQDVSVR